MLVKRSLIYYHTYMIEKVVGWILIGLGLIIILGTVYNFYGVMTRKFQPVQFFDFPAVNMDPSAFIPQYDVPEHLQGVIQKPSTDQKVELISADMLNQSSNLFVHLFFLGFIVNVGFKIAQLGTYLTRPIVVKLRETKDAKKVPQPL